MRRTLLRIEALVMLALTSLLIAAFPFRRIAALCARGAKGADATPIQAQEIDRTIRGWGRRVPWHAMCFQQGLAAQLMLRRRGLAAGLHYGAAHDETGLVAHVWVRSGDVDVIGCEGVERYGLLAVFPSD